MTQYPQVFTPPQPSTSRSWWKKKRYTMPGVALAGIVAIGAFAGPPEKKPIAAAPSAIASTSAPATLAPQTTAASPAPTPVATTEPSAPATIQGLAAAPAPTPANSASVVPKPVKSATVAPKPAPAKTAAPRPAVTTKPPAVSGAVTPGAFCGGVGTRGVSKTGKPMVCREKSGEARARWRAA